MVLSAKSSCFFQIDPCWLPPKNFNSLTEKLKPVEQWKVASTLRGLILLSIFNCDYKLSRRLDFPYYFKTKGMLLTAKSFCFFEINTWSLPQKNFNFFSQKLKPVEQWKVTYITRVNCQYLTGFLSYLDDSSFRAILKRKECF